MQKLPIENQNELEKLITLHIYHNNYENMKLLRRHIMYLNYISTNICKYKNKNKNKIQIENKVNMFDSEFVQNKEHTLYKYLFPLVMLELEKILSNNKNNDNKDICCYQLGGSSLNNTLNEFNELFNIPGLEISSTSDIDIKTFILNKENTVEDRKRCHHYNEFIVNQLLVYLNELMGSMQYNFSAVMTDFCPQTPNLITIVMTTPTDSYNLIDFTVLNIQNGLYDSSQKIQQTFFNNFTDFSNSIIDINKSQSQLLTSGLGFELMNCFYQRAFYEERMKFINKLLNTTFKSYESYVGISMNMFNTGFNSTKSLENAYNVKKDNYYFELNGMNNKIKKFNTKINNIFKLISFINNINEIHEINKDFDVIYKDICDKIK